MSDEQLRRLEREAPLNPQAAIAYSHQCLSTEQAGNFEIHLLTIEHYEKSLQDIKVQLNRKLGAGLAPIFQNLREEGVTEIRTELEWDEDTNSLAYRTLVNLERSNSESFWINRYETVETSSHRYETVGTSSLAYEPPAGIGKIEELFKKYFELLTTFDIRDFMSYLLRNAKVIASNIRNVVFTLHPTPEVKISFRRTALSMYEVGNPRHLALLPLDVFTLHDPDQSKIQITEEPRRRANLRGILTPPSTQKEN